jgi:hypothetical protein
MDEYYDDGYEEQDSPKEQQKTRTNPKGSYIFNMIFKGVEWDIKIENLSLTDFKISAKAFEKVSKSELEVLKRYLIAEGFQDAAKKHNLFW